MTFVNDSKHRHIIDRWKAFFATIKNSRSVSQNNAPFGSNQLSKFCHFSWKCVLSIQVFSSRTEGTITMRRPKGIDWHPRMAMGVVGDGVLSLLCRVPHRRSRSMPWVEHRQLGSCLPFIRHLLKLIHQRMWLQTPSLSLF